MYDACCVLIPRTRRAVCGRYVALWSVAVYFPMCHMVWGGPGALMADAGVLDFAGGIVVHITAGIGALVGALMLGPRKENVMACSNIVLTFIGTGTTHPPNPTYKRAEYGVVGFSRTRATL